MPDIVKLASALPAGDANGLSAIVSDLVDNPHGLHVVLAIVDCKEIRTNADTGEVTPVARIRRIESLLAEDNPAGRRLLRRAMERRTGRAALPLDLEEEVSSAFGD